jgi:hypothetical protein
MFLTTRLNDQTNAGPKASVHCKVLSDYFMELDFQHVNLTFGFEELIQNIFAGSSHRLHALLLKACS